MKSLITKVILLALVVATVMTRADVDITKDFDSLGGNDKRNQHAIEHDPNNEGSIVQKRVVNRHMHLEVSFNYSLVGSSDSYLNTQNIGRNLDFHISPIISIGGMFYVHNNTLTAEGKDV